MAFGRRRVAAAVCVLPLVLAGCAGDPEPKLAPPAETPTTESSPSATPTREPWEKKTNAGAVAFAKHWIEVFNEAQRTGDTAEMRALSAKSCRTCSGFARQLDALYEGGGHLKSKGWKVLQSIPTKGLPAGEAIVDLRIDRSPQQIHPGDGSEVERFPGGLATFSASLTFVNAAWRMEELELLQ